MLKDLFPACQRATNTTSMPPPLGNGSTAKHVLTFLRATPLNHILKIFKNTEGVLMPLSCFSCSCSMFVFVFVFVRVCVCACYTNPVRVFSVSSSQSKAFVSTFIATASILLLPSKTKPSKTCTEKKISP